MRTSELQGDALNWAVAQVEKLPVEKSRGGWLVFDSHDDGTLHWSDFDNDNRWQKFDPSNDWAQGGVIIEKENISIEYMAGAGDAGVDVWVATMTFPDKKFGGVAFSEEEGPTPLIAAMRCYVASELGDEVEVPDELHTV